jgi:hypothetical protein
MGRTAALRTAAGRVKSTWWPRRAGHGGIVYDAKGKMRGGAREAFRVCRRDVARLDHSSVSRRHRSGLTLGDRSRRNHSEWSRRAGGRIRLGVSVGGSCPSRVDGRVERSGCGPEPAWPGPMVRCASGRRADRSNRARSQSGHSAPDLDMKPAGEIESGPGQILIRVASGASQCSKN